MSTFPGKQETLLHSQGTKTLLMHPAALLSHHSRGTTQSYLSFEPLHRVPSRHPLTSHQDTQGAMPLVMF